MQESAKPANFSVQSRLLVITGCALAAFFLLTTVVLERAFAKAMHTQQESRLQAFIYSLLTAADETSPGQLLLPEILRDERLNQIDSGIYAYVSDGQGHILWSSRSALRKDAPAIGPGPIGDVEFFVRDVDDEEMMVARTDVIWEGIGNVETRYTFWVMESNASVNKAIRQFRHIVWRWLTVAAILIIVIQFFLMRWGMQPLRQVSRAIADIEAGKTEKIEGEFPAELKPLTDNINLFIQSEREQRKRYGETMANLAHSLKTPLAVLNTVTEREKQIDTLRQQVRDQVIRMNDIVRYQLQRAVTKGRTPLSAASNVSPLLHQIMQAMEKVHGFHRGIHFDLICPDNARFVGETGDFVEIMGNLLDNAGKWAKSRVRCHVSETKISAGRHALHVSVEDDGPGIAKEQRPTVLGRGERLDEQIEGQGIGLSVVSELVKAYQGKLTFGTSPELGGAWIHIELPL